MAFMTPRGLKIRLDVPYAFGLMARLYPKRTAFRILKTVEGLEACPAFCAFLGGMYALVATPLFESLVLWVVLGRLFGALILQFGLFIVPLLPTVLTGFSYFSGFGILMSISFISAFMILGWIGPLVFAGAWLLAVIPTTVVEFAAGWIRYKLSGVVITQSELNFFHACRLHASACDITLDLELTEEEKESKKWTDVLQDYAENYPEAVRGFL